LGDTGFDYFFQQRVGGRFVCGEAGGSFGWIVGFEFVREELHNGRIGDEQAAVSMKSGEADEDSFVLEHGDHVTDSFDGFGWDYGADDGAN